MKWLNEPPHWRQEEEALTVTTGPDSDFWRKTHYGFIRDTGHFYYEVMEGNFTTEIKISGQYRELYDQAGLMLRVDEENWIKTGIEYVDGVQYVSAVATRQYSDWSVTALTGSPPDLWLRVKRSGDAVEIHYSLDGSQFSMMRMAYLVPGRPVQVGPMCASPDGKGFEVRFEGLRFTSLA